VNSILSEIDAIDKPTLMVFNKIDQYEPQDYDETDLIEPRTSAHYSLEEWQETWMNKMGEDAVFISAINKDNLDDFRKKVYDKVRSIHVQRFPYNEFLYPDLDEV
jgi:GTP-binding protein HflX